MHSLEWLIKRGEGRVVGVEGNLQQLTLEFGPEHLAVRQHRTVDAIANRPPQAPALEGRELGLSREGDATRGSRSGLELDFLERLTDVGIQQPGDGFQFGLQRLTQTA